MKVAFISNYYNHHQKMLSRNLSQILQGGYTFITTSPIPEERRALGYQEVQEPFVIQFEAEPEKSKACIDHADIVICGAAPQQLTAKVLQGGKLVFQYSERLFKKKPRLYEMPVRIAKCYLTKSRYAHMYLLCASAFTAGDYAKLYAFRNKAYKWGYFPETKYYQIKALLALKDKQKILWVGRFLDWKHPDDALAVANRLKDAGYDFHMNFVGIGEMEEMLKDMARSMNLSNHVTFLGSMSSDSVREQMEHAGIYLFTSDRNEGWGAVLNESMNSGCAVVASHAIGAVPYLMEHKRNGLIYRSGNVDALYEQVKFLLDHPLEQERLGIAAYETIVHQWNAEMAAKRLVELTEHLLAGEKYPNLYADGPCSKAEIISDDWFEENNMS